MVEPFYFFNTFQIEFVEVACETVNLVHIHDYEIPEFPRQRDELTFSLFMEKMQPVGVLPCYFSKKQCTRYMTWKEARILFGPKNPYNILVLHFF